MPSLADGHLHDQTFPDRRRRRRKKKEKRGEKEVCVCVCVCVCVFSRPIIRSCNVSVPVPAADPSRCETVFSSAMFETVKMLETQTPN